MTMALPPLLPYNPLVTHAHAPYPSFISCTLGCTSDWSFWVKDKHGLSSTPGLLSLLLGLSPGPLLGGLWCLWDQPTGMLPTLPRSCCSEPWKFWVEEELGSLHLRLHL